MGFNAHSFIQCRWARWSSIVSWQLILGGGYVQCMPQRLVGRPLWCPWGEGAPFALVRPNHKPRIPTTLTPALDLPSAPLPSCQLCLLHHLESPSPSWVPGVSPSVIACTWLWRGRLPLAGLHCTLLLFCGCVTRGSACLVLIPGVTHFPCSWSDTCSLFKPLFLLL